jgi:hypothetical protein
VGALWARRTLVPVPRLASPFICRCARGGPLPQTAGAPDQGASRIGKPIQRSLRGDHFPNSYQYILYFYAIYIYTTIIYCVLWLIMVISRQIRACYSLDGDCRVRCENENSTSKQSQIMGPGVAPVALKSHRPRTYSTRIATSWKEQRGAIE